MIASSPLTHPSLFACRQLLVGDAVSVLVSACWSSQNPPVQSAPHRCGHPGQQHGRRLPAIRSAQTRSMCFRLVSGFFTEMTQQIHSLRARGLRSFHASRTSDAALSALRRSAGTPWTTPVPIVEPNDCSLSTERRLKCSDVYLLHLQHRLHGPSRGLAVVCPQHPGQRIGHDLP